MLHPTRLPLLLATVALTACCSQAPTDPVDAADASEAAAIELPDPGDELDARVQAILDEPDSMTIYALHPYPYGEGEPGEGDAQLHGYKILGQADVADAVDHRRVAALVYEGVRDWPNSYAACFNPRHGVRAQKGEDVVELVICFECLQMHAHLADGERADAGIDSGPSGRMTALFEGYGLTIHTDD